MTEIPDTSRMLCAEKLRKIFYPPRGAPIEAVRGASFEVKGGEVFCLLGPNGAGKTTLLRMLGAIIAPTSGYCRIDGVRTDEMPDRIRGRIGYLSGNTKLYGRLTGREMLDFFGKLHGMSAEAVVARTTALAGALDMGDFLDRRCETYSTGQSQKVSIARTVLHDPKMLILDEPTQGLDILTSRTILQFIRSARDEGCGIVFSTHYMTEADMLSDRVAVLHCGEILAMGTKEELYRRTGSDNLQDVFFTLLGQKIVP